jgi:hypothetical protein
MRRKGMRAESAHCSNTYQLIGARQAGVFFPVDILFSPEARLLINRGILTALANTTQNIRKLAVAGKPERQAIMLPKSLAWLHEKQSRGSGLWLY